MARIYLSGKISGVSDFGVAQFAEAEARWSAAGWEVVNPTKHFGGKTDLPRATYMKKDIAALLGSDAIGMLSGWPDSNGATLERKIAMECGLSVFYDQNDAVVLKQQADYPLPTEEEITAWADRVAASAPAFGYMDSVPVSNRLKTKAECIGDMTFRGVDGNGYKQSMDDPKKIPLALVPPSYMRACGRALQHGAVRYSAWNWKRGMDFSEPFSALQRHLLSWLEREETDPDSGLSHLDHAAACLAFLIEFSENPVYQKFDNRFKAQAE